MTSTRLVLPGAVIVTLALSACSSASNNTTRPTSASTAANPATATTTATATGTGTASSRPTSTTPTPAATTRSTAASTVSAPYPSATRGEARAVARYVTVPAVPAGWHAIDSNAAPAKDFTGAIWHYRAPGDQQDSCILRVSARGGVRDDMRLVALSDRDLAVAAGAKVLRSDSAPSTNPPGIINHYEETDVTDHDAPQHTWAWRFLSRGGTMVTVVGASADRTEHQCHVKDLVDAVRWTGTEHPGP